MKKYWGILLAAVMIVALSGCARIGIGKPGGNSVAIPDLPQNLSTPSRPGEEQIAETVLADQDGIKITALSLDVSTYGTEYPEMDVRIENNTSDEISVNPVFCSINNYRAEAYFADTDVIKPGASLETTLEFYFKEGDGEDGTDYLVYFDLNFKAFDPDTYETISSIGPVHLETTAAEIASPTYDDSGAVVVDNSDIKIVLDQLITDEDGSQYQEFFIYNKRGTPIEIMTEDVMVNGTALDPYFYSECDSGKYDMDWIYFYKTDMEEAGVDNITELELTLVVYDATTYDTIYNSGPLEITYD